MQDLCEDLQKSFSNVDKEILSMLVESTEGVMSVELAQSLQEMSENQEVRTSPSDDAHRAYLQVPVG